MKRVAYIFAAVLLMVTMLCSCSSQSEGIGEAGISADEFSQLWLGMTKEKVNSIIGGSGELISESKDENDDYINYISIYRYEGETSGYAELEFTQKVTIGFQTIGGRNPSLDVKLSAKTKYDLN